MNRQPLLEQVTQTMAVGSKSFATAAKLFDAPTRRSTLMLYAWCRHCDDVIDGQTLGEGGTQHVVEDAEARMLHLQIETRRAYSGAHMDEPAFKAFQEVALIHQLPPQLAFDHLEGFAMDAREARYVTFEDTLRYCYHVAGVVGLMMARVMGVRDEAVLDRACDLGLAFQLTNIARDIVEDAQNGRCYLPQSWLDEAGLTGQNLADPQHRAVLAPLAARLVSEAEPYYHSARSGLPGLPLRSAWAIATARGVYREIGVKVQHAGEHAWDTRQRTSSGEKLTLLVKGAGLALTSRLTRPESRPEGLWQRPR
ncbi:MULTISPECIES: 15-cis-phytoene synthase CrtB [unclassified Pantoea]|jgi:phytoene synthase|uniref:15-cis-phytoene synthase CrtB n=1 Tax=unclassified Pantoea TaxID=2630326 RepID=UPI001CD3DDCF|nr:MULTISPECIES: 15-cis-phytoene synthase CrtB [unclassified Pantoea]MCA1177404.1 phytoene/squalene synthase family protein [Pantoea sp. alder69]MCA1249690.1 phytoene/squalene synthase family protein [Pantoea sp. alder70]MCA1265893.1 phytoene/squalene synthase family protein [Pantoea sp. alder81]